jgi:hypothetical protein
MAFLFLQTAYECSEHTYRAKLISVTACVVEHLLENTTEERESGSPRRAVLALTGVAANLFRHRYSADAQPRAGQVWPLFHLTGQLLSISIPVDPR